ncbi:hypothetical protein DVT68_19270 [Dyella solisilvae]|uniref:Uncharacterized protein n=1 Tax=Dyella solisilvae TaxID=1920168 RepID=A0A370K4C1_9GAMM|nr:hypothetical protein [Dyella solisilvae]RDI96870.1 hypothetical protein DVT68_19270 [Dyella solisilvae]
MDQGNRTFAHEPLARAEVEQEERKQIWRMATFAVSLGVAAILAYLGHNDVLHRHSYQLALIVPLGLYVRFLTAYTQQKKAIQPLSLSELRAVEDLAQANPAISNAFARWRSEGAVLRQRDLAACKADGGKSGREAKLSDLKWDKPN